MVVGTKDDGPAMLGKQAGPETRHGDAKQSRVSDSPYRKIAAHRNQELKTGRYLFG